LEPVTWALSAQVAFQARQYPAALEHARRAILIDSQFWIGYMQLGQAYEQMGQPDLALTALTDAARFSGNNSKVTSLKGYLLAKTGRVNEAREVLRLLESDSHERYVPPVAIALVHAGLGEQEAVMEWLAKAYDARDVHLIYLPVDSGLSAIRGSIDLEWFSKTLNPAAVRRRSLLSYCSRPSAHRRSTASRNASVGSSPNTNMTNVSSSMGQGVIAVDAASRTFRKQEGRLHVLTTSRIRGYHRRDEPLSSHEAALVGVDTATPPPRAPSTAHPRGRNPLMIGM
jgi:hypothetical protein